MLTDLFGQVLPLVGGWDLFIDALPSVDLLWCLECSGETPAAATAAGAAAAAASTAGTPGGSGGDGGDAGGDGGGDGGEGGGDSGGGDGGDAGDAGDTDGGPTDELGPLEEGPPVPPPPPSFEDLLDKHSDSIRRWGERERILQDARDFNASRRPAEEPATTSPDGRPQRSDPTAGDIAEDVGLDLVINTGLDVAAGKGGYGMTSGLLGTLWTVASGSATLAEGISAVASSEGRGLGGGSQSARDVAEYMPGGSSSSGSSDGGGGGE